MHDVGGRILDLEHDMQPRSKLRRVNSLYRGWHRSIARWLNVAKGLKKQVTILD
jgi:hypothetical protein